MKGLRTLGWLLFASSVSLWGYGWISGEFDGHGLAEMDTVPLFLAILSAVCLLLAITVLFVFQVMKQMNNDKKGEGVHEKT